MFSTNVKWDASSLVVSILPNLDFGRDDHRKEAPHFIIPLSVNLGQIPLKLKFRCYNPVSMHLKTSSEFFKSSNVDIQNTCEEHAQLCENYHPDECPKSHSGGAIFLTIVLTGIVSEK